jgi:hypothetical protein
MSRAQRILSPTIRARLVAAWQAAKAAEAALPPDQVVLHRCRSTQTLVDDLRGAGVEEASLNAAITEVVIAAARATP